MILLVAGSFLSIFVQNVGPSVIVEKTIIERIKGITNINVLTAVRKARISMRV
jgi:hypothetical protein